jgi:hypothetical protein
MRHTLSVDFDGTIVDHAFPEIGKLKPGVKEALSRLIEKYDIVISSCRASQLFRKAPTALSADHVLKIVMKHVTWQIPEGFSTEEARVKLEEYFHDCRPKQIPDMVRADGRDYVREMEEFLKAAAIPYTRIDRGDEGKVVAVAYIDDRAIRYSGSFAGECEWTQLADGLLQQ